MQLAILFRNELVKQKRTLLWPFILIIPSGASCAILMDMMIRYKDYLHARALEKGITSWRILLLENHNLLGWGTFMPFFVAMLCAFVYHNEFNGNSWNKAMTLPVSKASAYFTKWLVVVFLSFLMILLNAAGLFIVGNISHFPEPFDLMPYLQYVLLQLTGLLGIAALHIWLSSTMRNMVAPISIGFIGSMISYSLFFNNAHLAQYFLYSFPLFAAEFNSSTGPGFMPALTGGLLTAPILLLAGYLEFRRRDIV